MERLFLREKVEEPVFSLPSRVKIGVVGAARGAGASLIATSAAKALSLDKKRRVSLVEILTADNYANKPLLYDSLGIDRRFAGREFISFYERIKNDEDLRGLTNVDERINWVLPAPEDMEKDGLLTEIEALRLINNISGDVLLCDLPSAVLGSLVSDMDILICVIDPLPSRLLAGESFIEEIKKLEANGKKLVWVINKYNAGINKRELAGFLRLRETAQFPLIPGELIYGAEYTCRLPASVREISLLINDSLEKILLRHKIFT